MIEKTSQKMSKYVIIFIVIFIVIVFAIALLIASRVDDTGVQCRSNSDCINTVCNVERGVCLLNNGSICQSNDQCNSGECSNEICVLVQDRSIGTDPNLEDVGATISILEPLERKDRNLTTITSESSSSDDCDRIYYIPHYKQKRKHKRKHKGFRNKDRSYYDSFIDRSNEYSCTGGICSSDHRSRLYLNRTESDSYHNDNKDIYSIELCSSSSTDEESTTEDDFPSTDEESTTEDASYVIDDISSIDTSLQIESSVSSTTYDNTSTSTVDEHTYSTYSPTISVEEYSSEEKLLKVPQKEEVIGLYEANVVLENTRDCIEYGGYKIFVRDNGDIIRVHSDDRKIFKDNISYLTVFNDHLCCIIDGSIFECTNIELWSWKPIFHNHSDIIHICVTDNEESIWIQDQYKGVLYDKYNNILFSNNIDCIRNYSINTRTRYIDCKGNFIVVHDNGKDTIYKGIKYAVWYDRIYIIGDNSRYSGIKFFSGEISYLT